MKKDESENMEASKNTKMFEKFCRNNEEKHFKTMKESTN